MTSRDRSALSLIIVAALGGFTLVAVQVSRASAQARVAKAKAQDAAALQSKEAQAAKEVAAGEAQGNKAQARAAAAAKGEPVTLDLSKYLVFETRDLQEDQAISLGGHTARAADLCGGAPGDTGHDDPLGTAQYRPRTDLS